MSIPDKRRALGKGLEALLPHRPVAAPAPAASTNGEGGTAAVANNNNEGVPLEIGVDLIDRNPYQTRSHFDEKALEELTASVAATGVVQPILVRPLDGGRYQLIAGERRLMAS